MAKHATTSDTSSIAFFRNAKQCCSQSRSHSRALPPKNESRAMRLLFLIVVCGSMLMKDADASSPSISSSLIDQKKKQRKGRTGHDLKRLRITSNSHESNENRLLQPMYNFYVSVDSEVTATTAATGVKSHEQIEPTDHRTKSPTNKPVTKTPTRTPSSLLTSSRPSKSPAKEPSDTPTVYPTSESPTDKPVTKLPTETLSSSPTSSRPSKSPTYEPSDTPMDHPTKSPTDKPVTKIPSETPSLTHTSSRPSKSPTKEPSDMPTYYPTYNPSESPTDKSVTWPPTGLPTPSPTSSRPSKFPTNEPSPSRPSKSLTKESRDVQTYHPTLSSTSEPPFIPIYQPTISQSVPRTFSAQTFIALDGITETIGKNASAILENVTLLFLNEQFSDSMEASKVTLLSQTIVASTSEKDQDDLFSVDSLSYSLMVELVVEGIVSNWTAFDSESSSRKESNESISSVFNGSILMNFGEFTMRLENESDFFQFDESTEITSSLENSSGGTIMSQTLIIILSGAALALVILAGCMIFWGTVKDITQHHVLERENSSYGVEDLVDNVVPPAYTSYSEKKTSSEEMETLDHILLDHSSTDSSFENDCGRVFGDCGMADVFEFQNKDESALRMMTNDTTKTDLIEGICSYYNDEGGENEYLARKVRAAQCSIHKYIEC